MVLPQIVELRRRLDAALEVHGSVDAEVYAKSAADVLDTVESLIASGHAAEARPLARHAVERITRTLLLIDSADLVVAACQRALGLYAMACSAARPNAVKLARWLFQLQVDSPGWPTVELAAFADALGDAGLAAYRALLDEAWQNRSSDSLDEADIRLALTLLVMRERLATFDGTSVNVADALPEGLPTPAAFLGVASGGHTNWLVEFLVQAYLDGGRAGDALELRRSELRARPVREHYAKLKETALRLNRWPEIRPWALDVLHSGGSGDDIVGAMIDDVDPDAAWAAAARYGCAAPLWLEVARHHAERRPADVLPGFRALIIECAARTGRRHYREAVALLHELRALSERCGRRTEFAEFVGALRTRHRRKRALLDELDRAHLS
ncbi:MAG TPA: hypothetical protein VGX25_21585 [Actinophytocola sp.]|uniref:hypothetical protein n=1 Tax=Actinophytocola sp. TaxID=1872138 RepID=UPI002DDCD46A|nr:hypothetical protein [Actinophytocola sp.]HEV2781990.1 hypothetical protein [Actinophytocola sp.]